MLMEWGVQVENELIIKEFLKRIASQDNRITAAPYFYVIRTAVERPAVKGCGDNKYYYDPDNAERVFESLDEYIIERKEVEDYENLTAIQKEEFDEKMEYVEYDLESYETVNDWVEKGMFLTETDAKGHLVRNHYHYSSDAHTYVKHCWRAPEMKEFFIALFNYFEIGRGNLDLREIPESF